MSLYGWVLEGPVFAQASGSRGGSVLVYDQVARHAVVLKTTENGQLLFNGEFHDVGEDLVEYLAIMDEANRAFPNSAFTSPIKNEPGRGGQL